MTEYNNIIQHFTISLSCGIIYKNLILYLSEILDRYYSMQEICKHLGISRDTALRGIATKNMPAHKIGKNWTFKVSEIDEWVNNGQAEE